MLKEKPSPLGKEIAKRCERTLGPEPQLREAGEQPPPQSPRPDAGQGPRALRSPSPCPHPGEPNFAFRRCCSARKAPRHGGRVVLLFAFFFFFFSFPPQVLSLLIDLVDFPPAGGPAARQRSRLSRPAGTWSPGWGSAAGARPGTRDPCPGLPPGRPPPPAPAHPPRAAVAVCGKAEP